MSSDFSTPYDTDLIPTLLQTLQFVWVYDTPQKIYSN